MSKELVLFEKENLTIKKKFYLLMELLISNQTTSRTESILFMGIFYVQIISGFFAKQIEVFNIQNSTSDKILNYIEKIFRLKDLFLDNYSGFKIAIFLLFGAVVVFNIFFFVICYKTTKNSFYTCSEILLNFYIKIYIYIGFNMILDLTLSNLCFESDGKNLNFQEASCKIGDILAVFLISLILLLISLFFVFFIQFFYCDSLYLSTSFYAKISCNYEVYINLHCIFYSIFLVHAKYLSKEIFLIYNAIVSVVFLHFYFKRYLFYDRVTNILAGLFHVLYTWTSLFFLIFAYIDFNEKGIIYIVSSAIVLYFYFNLKSKVEENILLNTPFYKISNKYYLLYYIKNLIDKMNNYEENPQEKVLLTGIMQIHAIECPNPLCLSKTKEKIYLPMSNEWSDRTKPLIHDKVFLINFIIVIMNYFISQSYYSPEMIINISLYYLQIIGNFCQALFYYKKVKEMKLTLQEQFSLIRLELAISKALVEKMKPPNEPCFSLEDLNVTMYYKYEDLSQNFFDEMNNDVNFSLEFWRSFRNSQIDQNKSIDFNKIFHLTDKIRITKNKVEKLWNKLIKIFNGVNELFDLYLEYVEQINDDDTLKRDLESIKRKNENSADHIQQNFYSLLFNKDTGIIIANGDKGKEGLIEKANSEVEAIFKYKPEELRGMNLSNLMPKLFAKNHSSFMERYFEIGEKRVLDNKDMKTFGKDKENSIIMIRLAIKLFPMLNDSVYFVGLIIKENIDDIIFMDSKFNIQGMSLKLMKILQIDNKLLFQDNEIPFYVICKKFVNFYKIFLRGKKQNKKDKKTRSSSIIIDETSSFNNIQLENNQNENSANEGDPTKTAEKENDLHENIEINENIELEYEIRLPQFLIDYSASTAKREQKQEMKLMKTISENSENVSERDNLNNKETIDEFGESDLLVDEENLTKSITPTPTAGAPTKGKTIDNQDNSNNNLTNNNTNLNNKMDFNKQSDEEKEFKAKLAKHKELFDEGKFNELEDLIDSYTADSTVNDFKFNFTFDRYKYGEKQMAYIVRCIDNKNEGGDSDEESAGDNNDPKMAKYRKEKSEAIKHLIELYDNEKKDILSQPENFIQLSLGDKSFQTLLNNSKEDIIKMSMIHGQKKEEVLDDENSSQSSQAGYNADLCKKNRIEEIRANIMKNVSSFYTLKYIKFLVLGTTMITFVFCALYLVFFTWIYNDLSTVSQLNIDLFQTTLWMSNLLSTLISLRTLFQFSSLTEEPLYIFNTYLENDEIYFSTMKNLSFSWYDVIMKNFGELEDKIGKYLEKNGGLFWGSQSVTYSVGSIIDTEAFPMGLGQALNGVNSLLKNEYFNLQNSSQPQDQYVVSYIDYAGVLAIENSYLNLLPSQFTKIKSIPEIFKDYNKSSIKLLLVAVVIYSCIMIIITVIYSILLYVTNKNMGEGLEKVTKIKLEKVEETIKRIEGFNSYLKKFRDKDSYKFNSYFNNDNNQNKNQNNDNNLGNGNATGTQGKNANNFQNTNLNNKNNSGSYIGYGNEFKQHKTLKILTYSYFQVLVLFIVLCSFLIPIFLVTNTMVTSTNKLINVQSYLFGKILVASASTVKVKCMMSICEIGGNEITYSDLVNKSEIQSIVQGISLFKELSDFYNNNFLLNACDTAFDKTLNETLYQQCTDDVLIQSANNTDSLLKLVDETVENIYKEEEMKIGKNVDYPTTSQSTGKYPFSPKMLFETSSFNELETVFYKYITPVSDNFAKVIQSSLKSYLNSKKIMIIILICVLGVIIVGMCGYIGIFFVDKLIHLLSVSRCILKIIPTSVINTNDDLQKWIEEKY